MTVTIQEMLKAGVHFGHQTRYWNPMMKPFLFGVRNGIHIIDLDKTLKALKEVEEVLVRAGESNGKILFVGTKRAASEAVRLAAEASNQFFVNKRWLGGTLTNWKTVRQSIRKLKDLKQKKVSGLFEQMTKKEALEKSRYLRKLEESLGGIQDMGGLPDLLYVLDVQKERIAVEEASKVGIPVIAIIDSNVSYQKIKYCIPGNDDSNSALKLYLREATEAIVKGREKNMKVPPSEEIEKKGFEGVVESQVNNTL